MKEVVAFGRIVPSLRVLEVLVADRRGTLAHVSGIRQRWTPASPPGEARRLLRASVDSLSRELGERPWAAGSTTRAQ